MQNPFSGLNFRLKAPSSRTLLMSRLSRVAVWDLFWAAASPLLAYLLRDGTINSVEAVAVYCSIALVCSFFVFQWFKISALISRYLSPRDALEILKACVITVGLTVVIVFTLTRLGDAPRSVPVLHFFVLLAGLLGPRVLVRLFAASRDTYDASALNMPVQNIIIIHASRLAWFFTKAVEEFAPIECQIIAILDDDPKLLYRFVNGYPVAGAPIHIEKIIDEYNTHGVEIDRVVVAGPPERMSSEAWNTVRRVCQARSIQLERLPDRLLFSSLEAAKPTKTTSRFSGNPATTDLKSFWIRKRVFDVVIAIMLSAAAVPFAVIVAGLVLIDIGYPVVFWQRRIGRFGRPVYIYKFRTMHAPFDRQGRSIPDMQRLSRLGQIIRKTRLDELPQLWNVLRGDMAVVGPRPLLPVDQPEDASVRLRVSPGLTGLAQINGGKLLSVEEKDAMDDWYVRHASLRLDIRILLRTVWVMFRGDARQEEAVAAALSEKRRSCTPS